MKVHHLLASAVLAAASSAAFAEITVLDFEGIAPYPNENNVIIGQFYNGGAASNGNVGPSLGVEFTADALLLCLNSTTVSCSNTSRGGGGNPSSAEGAMYWLTGNPFMNVEAGFTEGFSLAYSTPFTQMTIAVYSEINGGGTLLAQQTLALTTDGSQGACADYFSPNYCPFTDFGMAFAGIAKSVQFTGATNQAVIDDVTFGSVIPGIPEPSTYALATLGLAIVGFVARRRRAQ